MTLLSSDAQKASMAPAPAAWVDWVRRHLTMAAGGALLLVMLAVAALAPWLGTVDPLNINPIQRLRAPAATYWFGTDMLGRDVTVARCMAAASPWRWDSPWRRSAQA